jgi:uncharacterized membrane protein YcgQ (UPF0703/DUF1980 family)
MPFTVLYDHPIHPIRIIREKLSGFGQGFIILHHAYLMFQSLKLFYLELLLDLMYNPNDEQGKHKKTLVLGLIMPS